MLINFTMFGQLKIFYRATGVNTLAFQLAFAAKPFSLNLYHEETRWKKSNTICYFLLKIGELNFRKGKGGRLKLGFDHVTLKISNLYVTPLSFIFYYVYKFYVLFVIPLFVQS